MILEDYASNDNLFFFSEKVVHYLFLMLGRWLLTM